MEGKGREGREGTPRKNPGYGPGTLTIFSNANSRCTPFLKNCAKLFLSDFVD